MPDFALSIRRYSQQWNQFAQNGYGVVTPERKQINISEPIVVRHGSRYGVRMKATAPSIHMIQSMVETEIAPIVGSEQQAKDLVDYIESAAQKEQDGIWNTNIFGKQSSRSSKMA